MASSGLGGGRGGAKAPAGLVQVLCPYVGSEVHIRPLGSREGEWEMLCSVRPGASQGIASVNSQTTVSISNHFLKVNAYLNHPLDC